MSESLNPGGQWLRTRETLLHRLKDTQDHESWREFVEMYGNLIFRTALKTGLTPTEAEDVVQDTFAQVSRSLKDFDREKGRSFKTWLLQLTRWRIADQFKHRQPNIQPPSEREFPETATIDRVPDPNVVSPEDQWQEDWEKNLLETAIRRVKEKVDPGKYQIFDLCIRQNWPAQKVAQFTKTNVAMVYVTKHRISGLLKKEIERLQTKLA